MLEMDRNDETVCWMNGEQHLGNSEGIRGEKIIHFGNFDVR